jgi:hypothetical protein
MKQATIVLAYLPPNATNRPDPLYEVVMVTDSITYHPGEQLPQGVVAELCKSHVWKVTIRRVGG